MTDTDFGQEQAIRIAMPPGAGCKPGASACPMHPGAKGASVGLTERIDGG